MRRVIESKYRHATHYRGEFELSPGINYVIEEEWKAARAEDPRIDGQLLGGTIINRGKHVDYLRRQIAKDPELENVDLSALEIGEAQILARRYEEDRIILERLYEKARRSGIKAAFRAILDRTR